MKVVTCLAIKTCGMYSSLIIGTIAFGVEVLFLKATSHIQ